MRRSLVADLASGPQAGVAVPRTATTKGIGRRTGSRTNRVYAMLPPNHLRRPEGTNVGSAKRRAGAEATSLTRREPRATGHSRTQARRRTDKPRPMQGTETKLPTRRRRRAPRRRGHSRAAQFRDATPQQQLGAAKQQVFHRRTERGDGSGICRLLVAEVQVHGHQVPRPRRQRDGPPTPKQTAAPPKHAPMQASVRVAHNTTRGLLDERPPGSRPVVLHDDHALARHTRRCRSARATCAHGGWTQVTGASPPRLSGADQS